MVPQKTHDGRVLVLCKTVRLYNLSLNSKKMQFKSTDCKFFRHRLTPDGIKVDPKKIEAIIQMDPPSLNYFDKTKKHTIQCNVSKKGLGAVLLQESKPVSYMLRTKILKHRKGTLGHSLCT